MALYQVANGKVSLITAGTDLDKLKVEVMNHPDYIQPEKDELKAAVLAKINGMLLQKRPDAKPLSVPTDTLGQKILMDELQKQNQKPE